MANAPEQQLASLSATDFQGQLRVELKAAYGCWQRAAGTGLCPATWFATVAATVQAEAQDWPDAMALCHFAFTDALDWLASDWATAVLGRAHAPAVLASAMEALTAEAVRSPEAANAFCRDLRHLWRDSQSLRGREVMDVLRAALTGQSRGPCLGIVGALLGADRIRQRLEEARAWAISLST